MTKISLSDSSQNKKSDTTTQNESANETLQCMGGKFNKNPSNRGGIDNELALTMLCLKRVSDLGLPFALATEAADHLKLDDLYLEFVKDNQKFVYLLQAKHKTNIGNTITWSHLFNANAKTFGLLKYFTSYFNLRKENLFKQSCSYKLVICTTLHFNQNIPGVKVIQVNDCDCIFNCNEITSDSYKLEPDEKQMNKLIKEFKISEATKYSDQFLKEVMIEFFTKLIFIVSKTEDVIRKNIEDEIILKYGEIDGTNIYNSLKNEVEDWMKSYDKEGRGDHITHENNIYTSIIQKFVGPFFFLPRPIASFTGRTDEMRDLHNAMFHGNEKKMTTICGMGGVGKTEMAIKYATENSSQFDNNVLWINAEQMVDSFKKIAKGMHIPVVGRDGTEIEIDDIVMAIYKLLSGKTFLIVFDNAEKYKNLEQFLPSKLRNNHFVVLITTRRLDFCSVQEHGDIPSIPLNPWTESEALNFVKTYLGNVDGCEKLIETLGHLPLALQHAVAHIKTTNQKENPIKKYLNEFETSYMNILNRTEDTSAEEKTVFTTFKISVDKLRNGNTEGQLAALILNIMSYLAPDDIPKTIFFKLAVILKKFDKDISDDAVSRAIKLLENYSLVKGEEKLNVHRLVQKVATLIVENEQEEEHVLDLALQLLQDCDSLKLNLSHASSVWRQASKIKNLLNKYYFISNYGYCNYNPLCLMCLEGDFESVCAIVNFIESSCWLKRRYLDVRDMYHRTPLFLAAENGYEHVVQFLIDKGSSLTPKSNLAYHSSRIHRAYNMTPMHVAAGYGHLNVVETLYNTKSSLADLKDNFGRTPLEVALDLSRVNVVQFFSNNKECLSLSSLFHAVKNCDTDMVRGLLEKNDFLITRVIGKWTLLHQACFSGNLDIVELLVEKLNEKCIPREEGIDHPSDDGFTPLMCATSRGHLHIIKYLLDNNADAKSVNDEGWTVLHAACQNGHLHIVKFYVEEKGFDINLSDYKGDTCLHTSAFHGKLRVVKYLVRKGADTRPVNRLGGTPLFAAAFTAQWNIVKYFIHDLREDVNFFQENSLIGTLNLSVVHLAALFNSVPMLEFLLQNGGEKNVGRDKGFTPLHLAAIFNRTEAIKLLRQNSHLSDVDARVRTSYVANALYDVFNNGTLRLSRKFIVLMLFIKYICYFENVWNLTPRTITKLLGYNNELLAGGGNPFWLKRIIFKIARKGVDILTVLIDVLNDNERTLVATKEAADIVVLMLDARK